MSFLSATTTTELVFTGTPGERPIPIRRNTYTKIEGDFIDETTTRSQYIDHQSIQRAEIVKRTDNLTVGEGEFTVSKSDAQCIREYVTISSSYNCVAGYFSHERGFPNLHCRARTTPTTDLYNRGY